MYILDTGNYNIYFIITGGLGVFLLIALIVSLTMRRINKNKCNLSSAEMLGNDKKEVMEPLNRVKSYLPGTEEFEQLEAFDKRRCKDNSMSQGRQHDKSGKKFNNNDNILPFDFNRVVLNNPINKVDYLNASWISKAINERYDSLEFVPYRPYSKINFIVTQRPRMNTLPHFYQMVHENVASVIIAISDHEDKKCDVSDGLEIFGNTTVISNKRYNIHEHVTKNEIELQNTVSTARFSQMVIIYEYNSWTKPNAKDNRFSQIEIERFLQFLCIVMKDLDNVKDELTIVAHDDENGVGPAAIWIALYNLIQQFDEAVAKASKGKSPIVIDLEMKKLDVFKTVNELRKQRTKMVNSFAYYSFVFECLNFYCNNKEKLDKIRPQIEIQTEYYLDQRSSSTDYVNANSNQYQNQQNFYQNCS